MIHAFNADLLVKSVLNNRFAPSEGTCESIDLCPVSAEPFPAEETAAAPAAVHQGNVTQLADLVADSTAAAADPMSALAGLVCGKPAEIPEKPEVPFTVEQIDSEDFVPPIPEDIDVQGATACDPFEEDMPMQVIRSAKSDYSPATVKLALDMTNNHPFLKGLLAELRRAAQASPKDFRYDLTPHTQQERDFILDLTMRRMAVMLNDTYYSKSSGLLRGKVSEVPSCIAFLTGGYLEVAIGAISGEVLEEFSSTHDCTLEMLPNAIVTIGDGLSRNELDLLITLNDKINMVVEVKSGRLNFDKYYYMAQRYRLLPDMMLLICANTDDEQADISRDFMKYTICDADNYRRMLTEMLELNLNKLNNN